MALENFTSSNITKYIKNTNIDKALFAKAKALLLPLKDASQYGKPEVAVVQWDKTKKTETISVISFTLIPPDEPFKWQANKGSLELQNYKPTGGEIKFDYDPWGFGEYKSTVPFKGDIKAVNNARTALLTFINSIKCA